MALPDLAKAVVPGAPPILEIEFDYSRGKLYLYRQIYALGRNFTANPFKIKKAAEYAWETHKRYHEITVQQQMTRIEAIDLLHGDKSFEIKKEPKDTLTIGIAGHPYVLYDEQVSHNLIKRCATGVSILTPKMATENPIQATTGIPVCRAGKNYWESEEDVVGAALLHPYKS